ncbi:MAG: hypothetical protein J0H15_07245 [Xanthomonadales bacterium]|nr:hypothetical protein [Xanthomonadales bacterium]
MIRCFPRPGRAAPSGSKRKAPYCNPWPWLLLVGALAGPAHAVETQRASVPSPAFPALTTGGAMQVAGDVPGTPAVEHAGAAADGAAAIWKVTSCADDGSEGTLRAAAAGAASGDVIDASDLECGMIQLQAGEIELPVDDIVVSGPGRDALAIDGAEASRIFLHGGRGTLEIRGMTLTRGHVAEGNGGCVSSNSGNIALVDAAITECTVQVGGSAEYAGGGGAFAGGNVTVTRSLVSGNTARADAARNVGGGGVLTRTDPDGIAGDITVLDSLIRENRVESTGTGSDFNAFGGGLDSTGTVTILRSRVTANSVSSASADLEEESITEGGGVNAFGLRVEDSTFSGNSVVNSGGAMDVGGGALSVRGSAVITGSTIEGNHAGMVGGGVVQRGGIPGVSHLEIANSTVSQNTAGMYGAGLVIIDGLTMRNSTVAFNAVDETSPFGIGGVLIGSNETTGAYAIHSSIISNNEAGDQTWFAADLAVAFADSKPTIAGSANLIGETSGALLPADTLGADPLLLPLADNGGATRTHALGEGSPAVDAGNNAMGLPFDQRGPHHARVYGPAADIGAFEAQPPPDVIFSAGFES